MRAEGFRPVAVYGVRDCIVPSPGCGFYSDDFSGGELVTFAESAVERVGWSKMGEALLEGKDVHYDLGAYTLGISYDEIILWSKGTDGKLKKKAKLTRQAMKPENFGNPGGMGAARKVTQQREQGPDTEWPGGPTVLRQDDNGNDVRGYKGLRFCLLVGADDVCGRVKVHEWNERPTPPLCKACLEVATEGRKNWFARWTEARPFLDWHANNVDEGRPCVEPLSKVIRGGLGFCDEANGDFQSRLAVIAKRAAWDVFKEQYQPMRVVTPDHPAFVRSRYEGQFSPLYGSRNILFAHDELFGEAPLSILPDVSMRINELMTVRFKQGCPVHARACKAEPTIMPRWYKAAEPVWRDAAGALCKADHPEARLSLWTPS